MSKEALAYAAFSSQLSTDSKSTFRIIPAGPFKASDGRPGNGGSWLLTPAIAQAMIQAANAAADDYPIDYEHQTLQAAKNGVPAPAAGWFKRLEWRADGLYVTDARWTARAKEMIDHLEYRFISPVFTYNPSTFVAQKLHSIALTNTPALPNLTDLATLSGQHPPVYLANLERQEFARRMGLTDEQFMAGAQAPTAPEPLSFRSAEALTKLLTTRI